MKKTLALILALVMLFAVCGTALAAPQTTDEVTEREARNSDVSMNLATQGYVLLENDGVLPLKGEKKVALFGSAAVHIVKGGNGSGDVNQRSRDFLIDAFEAEGWEITNPTWIAKLDASPSYGTGGGFGGSSIGVKEDQPITDEELAEAKASDLVVYTISRTAGEGSDRTLEPYNARGQYQAGGYMLTDTEIGNITKLSSEFENFVLVFNTPVVDTSWRADIEGIDAVICMSNGGQRGSEALVKILTGEVTPSGKMVDTWPVNYSDYASAENFGSMDGNTNTEWYTDGIYVGYRYFDTFGIPVTYEFGYGLSYTDFQIDVKSVEADGENVTVTADVTNIGTEYSGKEVVEVYFSAPDGKLEKPYQELATFGKTDELAPMQKQTLTITFATTDMSSYDEEQAAYIMEAGDYIIRVGNSSRNTVAAAVITLDRTVITEQLSNLWALEDDSLEEITKEGAVPIANNDAAELEDAVKIALAAEDIPYEDNTSPYLDQTVTTYLFAEDYENYGPSESITLRANAQTGVIQNAANPAGPNYNGYGTTTYAEVKELVDALPEGITRENAKLTDVATGKITLRQFVACLSADELARIITGGAGTVIIYDDGTMLGGQASSVQGAAGQTTQAYYQTRHIPSMVMSDGPAGVRITQHYTRDGQDYYQFATAFPVGTCLAQTWDVEALEQFGYAVGEEMKEFGVTSWLAPGMNIHRNPICGRNFEYYSEDPLLSGMTAAYTTKGVQTHTGLGVTLKHFWGNNQEANRGGVNNVISERASREIYTKGFEIAVKLAHPMFMMACYQANNGWYGSNNYDTLVNLLRGEWGWEGLVMTDWGGGRSTVAIDPHMGNDLIMPGGNVNNILNGYRTTDPTFNADGSIRNRGNFVVMAGGSASYTTATNAASEEELIDSIKDSIANREAKYQKIGSDATITWYGEIDRTGKTCLGDLQYAAYNVLTCALNSQDMEKIMDEAYPNEGFKAQSIT